MKRILEGRWDCSQCGATRLRGREKSCPKCGDPRDPVGDPSEEPYLPSDADDITGTTLAAELGEKPDWICDHCGQANHSDAVSCRGCGQAHDAPDAMVPTRVWSGIRNVIPKRVRDKVEVSAVAAQFRRSNRGIAIGGTIVGLLVATIWGTWSLFFRTHEITLTVTELSWERSVEVEEFRTLQREDFNPPDDARIHDSFRAVHHYDQVLSHYRTETYTQQVPYTDIETYTDCQTVSNGNGTFTQSCSPRTRSVTRYRSETRTRQVPVYDQVPVYRTKHRYEIDRWVTDFFFTVRGDDDRAPFWPERIPPAEEPKHRVGDERHEDYTVILTREYRTYTQTPDFATWRTLDEGDTVVANVRRDGKIRSVEWGSRRL